MTGDWAFSTALVIVLPLSKSISFSWLGGLFRATFNGRGTDQLRGECHTKTLQQSFPLYAEHGNLIILRADSQSLSHIPPSFALSLFIYLSLFLSPPLSLMLSLLHILSLTHTLSLSIYLPLSLTHSFSFSLSLSLGCSHTPSFVHIHFILLMLKRAHMLFSNNLAHAHAPTL